MNASNSNGIPTLLILVGLLGLCLLAVLLYQQTVTPIGPGQFVAPDGPEPIPLLPLPGDADAESGDTLVLELMLDGTIQFEDRSIPLDQLGAELAKSHEPTQAVRLLAPPTAEHGQVKAMMDQLSNAGFRKIEVDVAPFPSE